ncbi:MAG: flagellar basal body P-ring formation chaperone FlgA [Syntrophales bacterium]|jgi:flagellar basal body P-ring formation protein FlgA
MKIRALTIMVFFFAMYFLAGVVSSSLAAQDRVIKGAEIKALVKDYIETNMPWQQYGMRIDFLNRISDLHVQGEKISCRVTSGQEEAYIGDSSFTVGVYDDCTLLREERVHVRMAVEMDVVMSTKYLMRDREIDSDSVKLVRKWFTQMPVYVVTQIEDVVGKQPYSDIRQNMEIKRNMLKAVKTMKRGKMVKIVLEKGSMTIITFGICEEDGSRGDYVKIRNTSSNKMVYARIMDDSSVRVEF